MRFLSLVFGAALAACGGDGSAPQIPPVDNSPPVIVLLGENPQFIEVGDAYVELGGTATDNVDGNLTNSLVIDASAVDTSTIGEYLVTYDVIDSAGNPAVTVRRTVVCRDTIPPVITLQGDNPQFIVFGNPYIELGASAADIADGDLTADIIIDASAVDTSIAADYLVTYDVSDSSGNVAATVMRTVTVQVPPPSNNARLSSLVLDAIDFDQIFQPDMASYTATTSLLDSTTAVTATTEDQGASVTVNGAVVTSGVVSDKLTLDVGNNIISVVVTAADMTSERRYSIEVTRQTAAQLAQLAYVKASNPGASDQFGVAVALAGNTLAVGAPGEDSAATGVNGNQDDNSAIDSGATYVFVRDPAGTWTQQAYIKASNTDSNDGFGSSLALFGDTLAVGAPRESSAATGVNGDAHNNDAYFSGAVYLFVRDVAGNWSQQAYVKASNTQPGDPRTGTGDNFGSAIALSGATLAVGAWAEDSAATGIDGSQDNNDAEDSGAVYLFERDGAGNWAQQAYIKASNTGVRDRFGHAVALSTNILVASAPWESSNASGVDGDQLNDDADFAGAAYVFTRDAAGAWRQESYLKASNVDTADEFGWSAGLSGNTIAIGAPGERSSATGIGGDQSDNSSSASGAVYIFTRNEAGTWSQQAYIKASNTGERDEFGRALAVYGDALVVGAPFESSAAVGINGDQSDNSMDEAGSAYVFTRDANDNWSSNVYVKASNTDANDWFGWTLALGSEMLGIGAPNEDSSASGIGGEQSNNDLPDSGSTYVIE